VIDSHDHVMYVNVSNGDVILWE